MRNMFLALVLMIYFAILVLGPGTILPSQENDANTVAELAASADGVQLFSSYAATAFVYRMTTINIRWIGMAIVGITYITLFVRDLRGFSSLLTSLILLVTPILLSFSLFTKETLLLPFLILTYLSLTRIKRAWLGIGLTMILYAIYGVIFRQYYLLIIILFAVLLTMKAGGLGVRLAIAAGGVACIAFMPSSVFESLQGSRDLFNVTRVGFSDIGNRTAFVNFLPPTSAYNFLINYAYAALRLNAPILFDVSAKELWLTGNMVIIGALLLTGCRSRSPSIFRPAALFFSHIIVLMLFEPDLGSYLRHATSALLLLAPTLALLDKRLAARTTTAKVRAWASPRGKGPERTNPFGASMKV